MTATDHIRDLASHGLYHIPTEQAAQRLGVSITAARAALRRLRDKGLVAVPYRGFHVIVPPEYARLGCLPAEQFVPQLMEHLGVPYYAGLLTAARYHGAAHQQPQIFQVMVPANRPAIRCGQVRVAFVARHNAAEMPTVRLNTPRGYVAVSTPEATAFDLVGYPRHSGGLSNVATVLTELAESLDPALLVSLAHLSPVPVAQRLGYLLETVVGRAECTGALADYVRRAGAETVPLSTAHKQGDVSSLLLGGKAERNRRWKLAVNVDLEPDL